MILESIFNICNTLEICIFQILKKLEIFPRIIVKSTLNLLEFALNLID